MARDNFSPPRLGEQAALERDDRGQGRGGVAVASVVGVVLVCQVQ